jgi:hypothetical protein
MPLASWAFWCVLSKESKVAPYAPKAAKPAVKVPAPAVGTERINA